MDNRTERQKFDDWFFSRKIASVAVHVSWEAWQAAKHDAKPVVELHETLFVGGSKMYSVLSPEGTLLKQFERKIKAKVWIIENGYRWE